MVDIAGAVPAGSGGVFSVNTAADAASFVIAVDGELDIATVAVLQSAFARALRHEAAEIVVDLTACAFIDSTGIGALLRLEREVAAADGRALLILPGPAQVQRTFSTCGLLKVLPFPDDHVL